MADKYTDPFDAAGPPKTAKSAGPEKYTDPFDAAQQYYGGGAKQGGTFETPSGQMPGVPTLSDTDRPLGVMDRMQSGTIEDPQAKLQFFASRRFPEMPIEESIKRYGYVDGDAVYLDDSGGLRRENQGDTMIPGNVAAWIGANALPTIGGTVGGVVGGAPGAALGGAAGKAYTKLAGQALGDRQSALGNAAGLAGEAAMQGIGWKAGEVLGGATVDRRVMRDAAKFQGADAKRLIKIAKDEFGIDITPAEASDLGSLISQQTRLGMGFDEAGDIMRQFLQNRAGQVDEAVTGYIGKPPPAATVGNYARDVGRQAVDDVTAARTAATKTNYRIIDKANPVIPDSELTALDSDRLVKSYIDRALNDPELGLEGQARNSYRVLDQAQKMMRDAADKAKLSAENFRAGNIGGGRQKIISALDRVAPGYRDAGATFARQSKPIEEVAASLEGTLANIKDTGLKNAANSIFQGQNVGPREVASVRRQFVSQGKEKEWNDVLNHWLRSQWEGPATKDVQAGASLSAGANFRKAVFGTKNQKQIMREAMGPDRYATFERLMDVLEATGRVPRSQSMTEPAQQAAKAEMAEASPIVSKLRGFGVAGLRDWWVDAKVGDWRTTLAKAITSPDGVLELEKLRKLKGMDPSSKAAMSIVTTALTKAGVYVPANLLEVGQPADELPRQLQQTPRR
jgi:hypothetical protein